MNLNNQNYLCLHNFKAFYFFYKYFLIFFIFKLKKKLINNFKKLFFFYMGLFNISFGSNLI